MSYDPLIALSAEAAKLPPLPTQVNAKVYSVLLNGVRQLKGEAGAIGVLYDFDAPIARLVCRFLPISTLRSSFGDQQVDAWEIQIRILEERINAQALKRNSRGVLQSTSPETLVFDGPWQASHDTPEQLIERQLLIRTGFHKSMLSHKTSADIQARPTTDPLIEMLKLRFGLAKLIESEQHLQVWKGKKTLIGIFDPENCSAAEILQAAIRMDELSNTDKKSLFVICANAQAMMLNQQLLVRLTKFDTSLLAADSRTHLLEQIVNHP